LLPERELEFTIDLKPGTELIARNQYEMLIMKSQELKMKLEDLLDLEM